MKPKRRRETKEGGRRRTPGHLLFSCALLQLRFGDWQTDVENLQQTPRLNLRDLLFELAADGFRGLDAQAAFLTTQAGALKGMLEHDAIPATFARNVEWAMQRRKGWLDDDHRTDPF